MDFPIVHLGDSICLLGFLEFSGLYAPGPIKSLVPTNNSKQFLLDFSPKKYAGAFFLTTCISGSYLPGPGFPSLKSYFICEYYIY